MTWHYSKNGETHGPVDAGTLELLVRSGALSAADLVWSEGYPDWRPMGQVAEFTGWFQRKSTATPPPLPGGRLDGVGSGRFVSPTPAAVAFFDEPSRPLAQLIGEIGDLESCSRCGQSMDDATLAVWHCAGVCEKADYLKAIGWSADKIRREGPAAEFNELGDPALEALLMNCVGLKRGDLVEGEDGLLEVVEGGYHFDSAWGGNKMGVWLSEAYESKERGDRRSYLAGWFDIAVKLYYMTSPFAPSYRETEATRSLLEVAFSIFQKLALEEYPQAARWVGFMLQCGYGTEVDYEKAANIFRWLYQNRSLDDDDEMVTESAMFLAQILYHKIARPEDGFRLFEALSSRDPRSAFYAGGHLFQKSDLAGAIRYLRVASDGGYKEAFTKLGRALIMNSKENSSDLNEGLWWLEKAAQEGSYEYPKGDPWALYWQAILYSCGAYGVPVDRAKASALLEEAVRRPGADHQTPDPEIVRRVEELRKEMNSQAPGGNLADKIEETWRTKS